MSDTLGRSRLAALVQKCAPRSLRMRLVLIVIMIDCVAALLTGSVIVWKARAAKNAEITSAMELAQSLVADTIRLMQNAPAPILLQSLDLHFQSLRHVRINVLDEAGRPVNSSAPQDTAAADTDGPPVWFSRLVGTDVQTKEFPIVARHQSIGTVKITSAPMDEIGEAWNYAHTLLITALCLNVAVIAALFLAFGRVLRPLGGLTSALKDLESKKYSVRLPPPSVVELATLTRHFNKAAEALSDAHNANQQLNRRLVAAQDEERRRTALELHDEVGPCLFALEATATSIGTMSKSDPSLARFHERVLSLVSMVKKVQTINRRVLDRLRPLALGRIPLRDSLTELLINYEADETGPSLDQSIGHIQETYGFLVDLTIYRCAQEGLLNAVRHAGADSICLHVADEGEADNRHIALKIIDDGHGFRPSPRKGLGLVGIRERIEAIAGSFNIRSSPEGTTLDITIPIDADAVRSSPEIPH